MKPTSVLAIAIFLFAVLASSSVSAQTQNDQPSEPLAAPLADPAAPATATDAEKTPSAPPVEEAVLPPASDSAATPAATEMPETEESGQPSACSSSCESYCSCWKGKGGGGPVMLLIFNRYNSAKYGDFAGPTLWYGGRGYGYVFDNRVRLGGMGAGGAGPADDGNFVSQGSDAIYYPVSTSRRVGGAYGGFTAEYVFSSGKYLEFPMGALLGFGYGGYSAELQPENVFSENVTTTYFENGPFIALQPMIGVEANALQWLKIQLTASYLFAKPFNDTRHLGGFTMVFGIMFGRFWPDEWKMPEEEATAYENQPAK